MTQKTWVLPIDDEGVISFPADLIEAVEWKEGTVLSWAVREDGSITLKPAADPHSTE